MTGDTNWLDKAVTTNDIVMWRYSFSIPTYVHNYMA